MMTYIFDNKHKRPRKIAESLRSMHKLKVRDEKNGEFLLSNDDMLISIGKKRTNIILYNVDLNIRNICKYFMRK
ncbi:MAG: hypothetical protein HFH74_12260 [Lachnospiraceae bacterium]|jgi:hypothetical protein|nr:hypothetical protein [Lachnospiraceae bacterium]